MVLVEDAAWELGVRRLRSLAARTATRFDGNNFTETEAPRIESLLHSAGAWFARQWSRLLEESQNPRLVAEFALLVGIVGIGMWVRIHFASFLDPFEDGYQNWWISSNLLQTGQYWDRHSMMTQGNWLPLYHYGGAAVLAIAGWHSLEALKFVNIMLSSVTAGLVYLVGRRTNAAVGLAAAAFFSLNFIDIVVSGWSTAESLAVLLVFLGYTCLFRFDPSRPRNQWIGAAGLTLAVLTRYEAWLVVGLIAIFVIATQNRVSRRASLVCLVPALAAMVGYSLYALQWGFLPELLIRQTSTDLRYQLSVGTQPNALLLLSRFWAGYFGMLLGIFVVGGTYAMIRFRYDVGSWIILALFGFVIAYTLFQFGNPSFRYVMIGVPFLSLFAGEGLASGIRRARHRTSYAQLGRSRLTVALTMGIAVLSASLVVAPATYWTGGFELRKNMEPLQRAGQFLAGVPLPEGKLLITESPIAAYYSGYPADRMLGSRWLPDDRASALGFLQTRAAFIVYVGVPYYKLRALFPELQNGTSTPNFELVFDGGGLAIGTHAVFVYRIRG
jgi:4-amino-4-deoxy-L-arabinose transferase-like glycosyltransferase